MYKIIDPQIITNNTGGNPSLAKQFIELYLIQLPKDWDDLQKAITESDLQKIKDRAHHIKPTMEYIGAIGMRIAFQKMEDMASIKVTISKIISLNKELSIMYQDLMNDLKRFKHSLNNCHTD